MATYRELKAIKEEDPDGWETEPTEEDYQRFKAWVLEVFGADAWREYHSNWDNGNRQ
jgi:hypothetical protein